MKTSKDLIYIFYRSLDIAQKSYKKQLSGSFIKSGLIITPDQWQILDIIVNYKDTAYSEIAAITGKDIASVNRIIDHLNRKGYVSRQTDPGNRRKVLLGVSYAGENIHKRGEEIVSRESEKLLSGIKEKRIQREIKLLKKIIKRCG